MADDLGYTPGTGSTVATDEIAGRHFQRIKLTLGADGANDGDVSSSNRMPVATGASTGAGAVDANTQRVTIASDGPLMTSIGAPADAAATTDTGTFSLLAFVKRGLSNWTTLLSRVPAPVATEATVAAMNAKLPALLATGKLPTYDDDAQSVLSRILQMLMAPLGYDKSLQRYRQTAVVESGTITTVTTCATVSNLAAIDGLQGRIQVYGANMSAWADCVRSRIS